MEIPTVKIKLGDDDYTIINEEDYDPAKHVLFDAPAPLPSSIPNDFPGAVALKDAGFVTIAELNGKTAQELTAIPGINKATAKAILAKLQAIGATEN